MAMVGPTPGYGQQSRLNAGYGARPGRVNTYFNSPYASQIANNLSAAIYGDPQADLTRQRIAQSQAEMQRQVEQDQLAADALKLKRDSLAGLQATMEAGGDWRAGIGDAVTAGVDLGDLFTMAGLYDPRYLQKVDMQGIKTDDTKEIDNNRSGNRITEMTEQSKLDLADAITLATKNADETLFRDGLLHGYSMERDAAGYAQENLGREDDQAHDINVLGREQGHDLDLLRQENEYETAESLLERQGDSLNRLISEGLWTDDLSKSALGVDSGGIDVLPNLGDATTQGGGRVGGSAGRGSSSTIKPPTPAEIEQIDTNIVQTLTDNGIDLAILAQQYPGVLDQMKDAAYDAYSRTNDAATAARMAASLFEITGTPAVEGADNFGFWNDTEATPATVTVRGRPKAPVADLGSALQPANEESQAGPAGTPIQSGDYAGHTKGDDGKIYNQNGEAVARWK